MPQYYEYELAKAAHKLVAEWFKLKPGETFVVSGDTESDARVVEATAAAAYAVGAKPLVIWNASPLGVGKAAGSLFARRSHRSGSQVCRRVVRIQQ